MKIFVKEQLSPHKYKTPQGYLICTDAILARTGKQMYKKGDFFPDCADSDADYEVDRREKDVFDKAAIASFENMPLTVEHPMENVTAENIKEYAVGYVRDVHQGEWEGKKVLLGNLVIQDAKTVEEIEQGEHVQLSCGYDCEIADSDNDPHQVQIRGNHVALCAQGRAGIAQIQDSVKDSKVKDVEPHEGEDKESFISRFMRETKEEYPDSKQRLAVAYSYWKKAHDSTKDSEGYRLLITYHEPFSSKQRQMTWCCRYTMKEIEQEIEKLRREGIPPSHTKDFDVKVVKEMFRDSLTCDVNDYSYDIGFEDEHGNYPYDAAKKLVGSDSWIDMIDGKTIYINSLDREGKQKAKEFAEKLKRIHPNKNYRVYGNKLMVDSLTCDAKVEDPSTLAQIKNMTKVKNKYGVEFVMKDDETCYASQDGQTWYTGKVRVIEEYNAGKTQRHRLFRVALGGGKESTIAYSRLLYGTKVGPISSSMEIDHLDGDHMNDKLSNYEVVSSKENMNRNLARIDARKQQSKEGHVSRKYIEQKYGASTLKALMEHNDVDRFVFNDSVEDANKSVESIISYFDAWGYPVGKELQEAVNYYRLSKEDVKKIFYPRIGRTYDKSELEHLHTFDSVEDAQYPSFLGYINGTMAEFNPKEFIGKVQQRKESLHTNRISKATDNMYVVYTIACELIGFTLDECKVWIDVVKETWTRKNPDPDMYEHYQFQEKQDRVLMERCGSDAQKWDKAIKVLENFKSKHIHDSKMIETTQKVNKTLSILAKIRK